jgi:hypothetical protein
LLTY